MKSYVYAIRVDGVVRYIGKGIGRRVHRHLNIVRSVARRRAAGEIVRTSHFYNRLTKAWLGGAEIDEVIIVDEVTNEEACKIEIKEIAKRKSQLWNTYPGGDGGTVKGFRTLTAEQKHRIAESNRKTWADPKLKAQHGERCKIVLLRPDVQEKIRKPKSTEHNQKVSERAKARWADPAFREKMAQRFAESTYHQTLGARMKAQWADPLWRQKMLTARRKGETS